MVARCWRTAVASSLLLASFGSVEARASASRSESQPTTARRGVAPLASRTNSAWISRSPGRVPSSARERFYDLGRALAAYRPAAAGAKRGVAVPVDPTAPFVGAERQPNDARVAYTGRFSRADDGFFMGDLHFWDHAGTHLDAPRHYVPAGSRPGLQKSVGDLELSQLHGRLVIIDTSARVDRNVTAADINAVRSRLVAGAWLLGNLGHAVRYGQSDYGATSAPGFTLGACERLSQLIDAGEVSIAGIGADNASVDRGANFQSIARSCHGLLLPRDIPILENLAELTQVSADAGVCELIVAPVKVLGASGAPARVFARCQ